MKKELITYHDSKSPIYEKFKTIENNLQIMDNEDKTYTILITSIYNNEGKSFIASNLAVMYAQTGKKVILIDEDMQHGEQYTIFEVSPRPGLSNYLSTNMNNKIDEFIQKTEIENLSIISSGSVIQNSSELLVSNQIKRLINKLKEKYEVIIFDSTPSLTETDAIILSRLVDTTLLVTDYKKIKINDINKVKNTIENIGGNIGGIIVNKIPVSRKKDNDYNKSYKENETIKKEEVDNIEKKEELDQEEKEYKDNNKTKKVSKNKNSEKKKKKVSKKIKESKKNNVEDKKKVDNIQKKKRGRKPNRSKDILVQINKYMEKQ